MWKILMFDKYYILFAESSNLFMTPNDTFFYNIITNWTSVQNSVFGINLSNDEKQDLYYQPVSLDILQLAALKLRQVFNYCNGTLLNRYLKLNSNPLPIGISIESMATQLCSSSTILPTILQNIRIQDLKDLATVSNALNPENLASAGNMTLDQFKEIQENWIEMSKIYGNITQSFENLLGKLNIPDIKEKLNITEITESSYPAIASNFMCGDDLIPDKITYKPLQPISNETGGNFQSLDTHCSILYKYISQTWEGQVVWRYLSPFIQGTIFITPKNGIAEEIVAKSLWFFSKIEQFRKKVNNIGDNYQYLNYIEGYEEQAKILSTLFQSNFYQEFRESFTGEMLSLPNGKFSNLMELYETIKANENILSMVNTISLGLKCLNTKRFDFLENESDILAKSRILGEQFLAGIVILPNDDDVVVKRDISSQISKHIQYKIRMEVDHVPITSSLKERLWVPGPDGDFYYNMRYFWGFLQIQDLVDSALIEIQTKTKPLDQVLMQQFPYPCFIRNNYLSGIYTAQLLQVVLIFAFSLLIATFVREFVWERESKNGQILQVMGMKSFIMWTSNFMAMGVVFTFNAILVTILLHFGEVLPKTRIEIILLTIMAYSFSLMNFTYMLSMILQNSTSGAVTAFLFHILAFLPFLVFISLDEQIISELQFLIGFFMNTAFGFTLMYITRYEQQQVGLSWEKLMISPMDNDNFNFLYYIIFLLVDGVIYGLIGFVISKLSNMDGTWSSSSSGRSVKTKKEFDATHSNQGITLVSLTKEFRLGRKSKRIAVNSLNLHFNKNEITGLLGHNGAGKSTTMSMLTGIIKPTSGFILVDGTSFNDQWDKYIKMVGFCPQQGILYENLNTEEHIRLYSKLKSSAHSNVEKNVQTLLMKMRLEEKNNTLCKHLSEGLRRRLAIAMAFAGDSTIVILDEPTSGVDSSARRCIWDFITECKEGKTIIITTHQMDEAEILCDNIAIIHKGQLLSSGPTLELQQQYGKGLQLNISQGIKSNPPTEVTSVSSSRMSMSSLRSNSDQIDAHISRIVPRAEKITHSAQKRSYTLPVDEGKDYSKYHELFAVLENEKKELEISTFSIASPNLEDIFLSMTSEANFVMKENIKSKQKFWQRHTQVGNKLDTQSLSDTESNFETSMLIHSKREISVMNAFTALLYKRYKRMVRDRKMMVTSFLLPSILLIFAMILGKIRPETSSPALLMTPSIYGPESYTFLSIPEHNLVSDALKNPPGIGTTCMQGFKSSSSFTECSFQKNITTTEKVDQDCSCSKDNWHCKSSSSGYQLSKQKMNSSDILVFLSETVHPNKWILDTHYQYVEKQYGGWRLSKNRSIVYYNNKGFHSSASYLNSLNNARLRAGLKSDQNPKDYGITVYNHPFRSTQGQILGQSILQHVSDYTLALFLLTVVSFVPVSSIIYLIQERTTEEKLVLKTFGVGPIMYWTVNLVWDSMIAIVFLLVSAATIKIFGIKSFSADLNFVATLLLFFLFCLSINTMIYLIEKAFTEPGVGQVLVFTGSLLTGVLTLILMLLMQMYWWIKPLADARKLLKTLFLILPPYALGKKSNSKKI